MQVMKYRWLDVDSSRFGFLAGPLPVGTALNPLNRQTDRQTGRETCIQRDIDGYRWRENETHAHRKKTRTDKERERERYGDLQRECKTDRQI